MKIKNVERCRTKIITELRDFCVSDAAHVEISKVVNDAYE